MALGQIQLKQLNQAQISGFVAQVAATGVVIRPEETGGFIDLSTMNNSGTILWNRDWALSGLLGNATGNINIHLGQTGQNLDLKLIQSGTSLWNRDEGLSASIVALSGASDVGASGQTLWSRDTGLSYNISGVSGNVGISGQTLWVRDTNLSANIAALSGISITSSQTGSFLTQSDSGNFITADIVFSLSGNLVATGGVFNVTGLNLFNRDLGLSSNIAALSGVVALAANTGDFLDPSDTGLFLTQANSGHVLLLYLSGKEIAATETNTLTIDGVELAGGGGDLTHASGSLLFDRDTELSNNLADVSGLIGGGGTTINGLDGVVQITGTGNIFVFADSISKVLTVSGSGLATTEGLVGLSDSVAEVSGLIGGGGDLTHASGTLLWNRDESLSGSFNETGLDLWNRDFGLSESIAAVSGIAGGWDHSSGTLLWNRDDSLSGSLVGLSDEVALVSGLAIAGGGGGSSSAAGSSKTAVRIHASKEYTAPATGWAYTYYATGVEYVRFDTDDAALYQNVMPEGLDLNFGLNITLFWHPEHDAGNAVWLTYLQRTDIIGSENWSNFGSGQAASTGKEALHQTTIHHDVTKLGGIRSGDAFQLMVVRTGVPQDTLANYTNLHYIHIESPVSRTITKTFDRFTAVNFTPPSTGYAQIDWISGVRTMQLHPDSGEAGMFDSVVPENIDLSNGIRVHLHWFPEQDNANDVEFITAFGKRNTVGDDSFGTEITTTATSTGAGRLHRTFVDHSSAQIGGITSGDFYRLKVGRSGTLGGDTMAGNAHVTQIELETR